MKITLDQTTLGQAVISHLRSVGVQSDILGVEFRYTRVPYTVFAEVELAEAKIPAKRAAVVEKEHVVPDTPPQPLVNPDTLPPAPADEEPDSNQLPSDLPSSPLFSGG